MLQMPAPKVKWSRTKTRGRRWCSIQVELRHDGELSICGEEGRIVKRAAAKKEALAYWVSFFEENPAELGRMAVEFNRRTPTSAARYVLATDGEFHGLDVVGPETTTEVRVLESCGQIRDTLTEWFPECAPFLPYHLNHMHAGCEHQDALGWGHGHDVALSKDEMTEIQREALTAVAERSVEAEREKRFRERIAKIETAGSRERYQAVSALLGHLPTIEDMSGQGWDGGPSNHMRALNRRLRDRLSAEIAGEVPTPALQSQVFKDSLCAPCPVCGYRYGTAWLKRPLPAHVVKWAESEGAVIEVPEKVLDTP